MAKSFTISEDEHRLILWLRSNLLLSKARHPVTEQTTDPNTALPIASPNDGAAIPQTESPFVTDPSPPPTPPPSNAGQLPGADPERNILYEHNGFIVKRSSDDPANMIISFNNQLVEFDGTLLRALVEQLVEAASSS